MIKFFFFTSIILLAGCSSPASKKKKILEEFDSVNKSLLKTNSLRSEDSIQSYLALVDSLTESSGATRQFYYHVHDFYGYMHNIRSRFLQACGANDSVAFPQESWNKTEITNAFFADKKNTSDGLYGQLTSVIDRLKKQTKQDSTLEKIRDFESKVSDRIRSQEDLEAAYFHNMPPASVNIILNSFEQTVRNIEFMILKEIYKH